MNCFWEALNKIAIVGTIIGIPAALYGLYTIIYNSIITYDMYREMNDAGGYTLEIGDFTRNDYRIAKKNYPNREYHKKGFPQDAPNAWK